MKMKKYQAGSMAEAIAQIRAELGPNAVILHASESRKGLLSKAMVEVVAAVDPAAPAGPSAAPAARPHAAIAPGARAPNPRAPSSHPGAGGAAVRRAAAV